MIDSCIKKYLDKVMNTAPKVASDPDPKKEILTLVLPFLGRTSLKLRNKLRDAFKKTSNKFSLRIVFRASCRMKSVLRFKDRIPEYLRSHFVYEFKCNSCNAVYIGETFRHQHTRFCEHMGISGLTGKEMKSKKDSAIRDHLLTCDGVITHDSFVIIGREADLIARRVKESLFIHRDEPSLNVQGTSIPLKLFK